MCTGEAMPQDVKVYVVEGEEVHMCSDHERGHIFTDRLLNSRSEQLTMFLGSHTMKSVMSALINNIEFVDRERYSKL